MSWRASRRWLYLISGLALIWLVLAKGAPWLAAHSPYRELSVSARQRGIEPDALFYTDLEPAFLRSRHMPEIEGE